jgi:hypothetical protein
MTDANKKKLLIKLNYLIETLDWDSSDFDDLGIDTEDDSVEPIYEIRTALLEIAEGLS